MVSSARKPRTTARPLTSATENTFENTFEDQSFFQGSNDVSDLTEESRTQAPDSRLGQPLRVCLACGEEDPSAASPGSSTLCSHSEIAVFAAATKSMLDAVDRLQSTMDELSRRRKTLDTILRSATQSNEAVVDRATPAEVTHELSTQCEKCEEREAQERAEAERKRAKREQRGTRAKRAPEGASLESAPCVEAKLPTQFVLEFSPPNVSSATTEQQVSDEDQEC